MSGPEDRLAALGLSVPDVAKPVATYVPALRTGNYIFTSGQLPMRSGELMYTGKVGGEISPEEGVECAQQCALNAIAAVKAETRERKIREFVAMLARHEAPSPQKARPE